MLTIVDYPWLIGIGRLKKGWALNLRNKPIKFATALLLAFFAVPVMAKDGLAKLQLSPLHVLATANEGLGQVRTAMPGDVLIEAMLGYGQTARFLDEHKVVVATLPFSVTTSQVLRAATPMGADTRFAPGSTIYCTGSIELPRRIRSPGNAGDKGARFDRETHLCMIDDGADGNFNRAFLDGARWSEDQDPVAISTVGYAVDHFTQFGAGKLRVTYEKGALLQGAILSFSSNLVDDKFQYADARIGPLPAKAPSIGGERGIKSGTYPKAMNYGDAQVIILGIDQNSRVLTYRIDHGFETRPAIVTVGFYGTYGSTTFKFE